MRYVLFELCCPVCGRNVLASVVRSSADRMVKIEAHSGPDGEVCQGVAAKREPDIIERAQHDG